MAHVKSVFSVVARLRQSSDPGSGRLGPHYDSPGLSFDLSTSTGHFGVSALLALSPVILTQSQPSTQTCPMRQMLTLLPIFNMARTCPKLMYIWLSAKAV